MQELRFVGLEDDWLIATNDSGDRFRLRADESLREALRPRPASRPEGPRVPPRQIQQLIRSGRTVVEVVELTGADAETVERFEGPILAERAYMVEQARAVPVRLQTQIDPLSREATTFGAIIDDRLEQLGATDIDWDAWKDPDTGWHVGLDFVTEDVARNALWSFDPRAHALQPASPAAITLSQQGEPTSLMGPHLRAVKREPTGGVIPIDNRDANDEINSCPERPDLTANETADLLEALRRRRGERQHATYDEEAELALDSTDQHDTDEELDAVVATRVTPFARPAEPPAGPDSNTAEPHHQPAADEPDRGSASGPAAAESQQVPLDSLEPETTEGSQRSAFGRGSRKRSGRPSMPSWDEIVFGTKSDDE